MATIRQGMTPSETYSFRALGPTQRVDGTPLAISEISHYIRYVNFSGTEESMIVNLVEDANTPEYDGTFDEVVSADAIAAGTYLFYYSTVDSDGQEGPRSTDFGTLEVLPPFPALPNPPSQIV